MLTASFFPLTGGLSDSAYKISNPLSGFLPLRVSSSAGNSFITAALPGHEEVPQVHAGPLQIGVSSGVPVSGSESADSCVTRLTGSPLVDGSRLSRDLHAAAVPAMRIDIALTIRRLVDIEIL